MAACSVPVQSLRHRYQRLNSLILTCAGFAQKIAREFRFEGLKPGQVAGEPGKQRLADTKAKRFYPICKIHKVPIIDGLRHFDRPNGTPKKPAIFLK
ncbi:hypothetical protein ACQE3E_13600 [Methylomonas sp. MED-D]|uniref:hypothetical protein n=1 Tax=unclassified Methylomonas TaxID=2608980 RepID=UPI0028A32530|nr:hypothetical protein [Methylomonas sp. MV1]MDT4331545.1 hypothetical protein [Methylomonas sp. MV1]